MRKSFLAALAFLGFSQIAQANQLCTAEADITAQPGISVPQA
jgi:hypothetical protein